MLSFLFWLVVSLVFMSFVEYVAHRWPMHSRRLYRKYPIFRGPFERHAILHHGRYFKVFDREDDPAARYISMWLNPIEHLIGLSPVWLSLFWFVSPVAGLTLAAVIAIHAIVWSMVHFEMHEPKHGWLSRTWYFRYLRQYHKTHHDHPGTNFNAALPGMDWLFGTYRRPE